MNEFPGANEAPQSDCSEMVFNADWVEQKRTKYGHLPEFSRPIEYDLWTAPDLQPCRDEIEQLVDELVTSAKRSKVIATLRIPDQYRHTYHELVVGDSLHQLGHVLEYEADVGNLTPDWRARHVHAGREFIVEVLTSNPPEDRARADAAWNALRLRISCLNVGASVCISPPMDIDNFCFMPPPASGQFKRIARNVHQWLLSKPTEGDCLVLDGISFQFAGWNEGGQVSCGTGMTPYCVDPVPLKDAVMEKASRYKGVIAAARLPFVVCVIVDFSTGRGFDELQDAVLGTQRCRIHRQTGQQWYFRDKNGLFARYPTLSAVTLGKWVGGKLIHGVVRNSQADFPLPEATFPEEYLDGQLTNRR